MKKIALVAALALGLMAVAPQGAEAKDMAGRFGVGADSSLGWKYLNPTPAGGAAAQEVTNTGLSVVYYITKMFGLQLIVGSTITTVSGEGDVEGFAHLTGVGVRGHIPIAFTNEVNLGAVIGFSGVFGSFDNFTGDVSDDDVEPLFISFDIGLRPEWFITDHFSIHTQVGLVIALLNEDNTGIPDGGGVTIDVFANADLLGAAGFTFWF